jgi:DNA-binding NtrC family response regulator
MEAPGENVVMATAKMSPEVLPLILLVNHEPASLSHFTSAVDHQRYRVESLSSVEDAVRRLKLPPMPRLVLMKGGSPGCDGLHELLEATQLQPEMKFLVVGTPEQSAADGGRDEMGEVEYVAEPFASDELDRILGNPAAPAELQADIDTASVPDIVELGDGVSFVSSSPAMKRLYEQAYLVARFNMPILVLGESGTGKEVLSLLIHHLSPRANAAFLKVNCAAVPSDLLESELFGHEAGAFTGATKAKPGKFEQCEGGTLFLDEIGEMAPALQAKLLHFLQDHRFSRLGGRTTLQADVRIVAATNVNVEEALASKVLREDLYYRLSGFTMQVPPLRERRKEIPTLLTHFMKRSSIQFSTPERRFSPALLQACLGYSWPGNLRQLENFVRRYLILGDEALAVSELKSAIPSLNEPKQTSETGKDPDGLKSLARSVKREAEAAAIAHVLEQTNWHRQKAAVLLRISYKALLYKIKQYDLHPPDLD